jgi:hypothetical protein
MGQETLIQNHKKKKIQKLYQFIFSLMNLHEVEGNYIMYP